MSCLVKICQPSEELEPPYNFLIMVPKAIAMARNIAAPVIARFFAFLSILYIIQNWYRSATWFTNTVRKVL